jgi:hypothetical protein
MPSRLLSALPWYWYAVIALGLTLGSGCRPDADVPVISPSHGAQQEWHFADEGGRKLNILWVIDASATGTEASSLVQKLAQAAALFPPVPLARAHLAVIISGDSAPVGTSGAPAMRATCPAAPTFWNFSNYCGEPGDVDSLAQTFACAIDGAASWKTARQPLDAVDEFLNQDFKRTDGLRFAFDESWLHVVIVSQRDDASLTSVPSAINSMFLRRARIPERIVVTVVAPLVGTPRLHEYSLAFGANGQHIDVASSNWRWLEAYGLISSRDCLQQSIASELSRVDRKRECFVQDHQWTSDAVIINAHNVPACYQQTGLPCWEIQDLHGCPKLAINRGGCLPPPGTGIRLVCASAP